MKNERKKSAMCTVRHGGESGERNGNEGVFAKSLSYIGEVKKVDNIFPYKFRFSSTRIFTELLGA